MGSAASPVKPVLSAVSTLSTQESPPHGRVSAHGAHTPHGIHRSPLRRWGNLTGEFCPLWNLMDRNLLKLPVSKLEPRQMPRVYKKHRGDSMSYNLSLACLCQLEMVTQRDRWPPPPIQVLGSRLRSRGKESYNEQG